MNGAPDAYDPSKCKYSWTITSGKEPYSNNSSPVLDGNPNVFINWDNTNGSGIAKVVISSVTSGTANVCPLLGGSANIQRELSVPIQYLGPLDAVRLNGTPVSTASLNCGTNTITLSQRRK